MHPNMNNFSNITDINPDRKLLVKLDTVEHGTVQYRLRINGHLVLDDSIEMYLNLFSPINLHCFIVPSDENSALEIKSLSVNGFDVLPRYMHLASAPTLWLTEGEWSFSSTGPFYPWYHEISGQGFIA